LYTNRKSTPSGEYYNLIGASWYRMFTMKIDLIYIFSLIHFEAMISNRNPAFSCDTFVVLPPLTDSNFRIFGKNSDRPANEVQEIIFVSNEHTNYNQEQVQVVYLVKINEILLIFLLFIQVYAHTNTSSFKNLSMYSIETSLVLGSRNGFERTRCLHW